MPDTATVLRQSIKIYVDALRKIDAVKVAVPQDASDHDAMIAYCNALAEAQLIARQALPITY